MYKSPLPFVYRSTHECLLSFPRESWVHPPSVISFSCRINLTFSPRIHVVHPRFYELKHIETVNVKTKMAYLLKCCSSLVFRVDQQFSCCFLSFCFCLLFFCWWWCFCFFVFVFFYLFCSNLHGITLFPNAFCLILRGAKYLTNASSHLLHSVCLSGIDTKVLYALLHNNYLLCCDCFSSCCCCCCCCC